LKAKGREKGRNEKETRRRCKMKGKKKVGCK
jgi:hypothetical protein